MAALTRRESEERQNAVLRFFMENPDATGEEAQRALTTGRLTNRKPQPPMGLGMLFRLQREAKARKSKGQQPPAQPPPRVMPEVVPPSQPVPNAPAAVIDALRARAKELSDLVTDGAGGVLEIHITKDGVRIVRLQQTEEKL